MRTIILGVIGVLLSSCIATTREPIVYTQTEIDAINARIQCKQLARNLVQISRCEGGR
jgi:hypothetical protein